MTKSTKTRTTCRVALIAASAVSLLAACGTEEPTPVKAGDADSPSAEVVTTTTEEPPTETTLATVVAQTTPTTDVTTTTRYVPPATTPAAPPTPSAFYANCDEARAAGAAPLRSGDPGYRPALDRDKDGVACE